MAREPVHVLELRRALGHALALCRRQARWSQGRLAAELHYHRTAICHLEAGGHPAPATSGKRADTLLAAEGALLTRYDELAAAKRDSEGGRRTRRYHGLARSEQDLARRARPPRLPSSVAWVPCGRSRHAADPRERPCATR